MMSANVVISKRCKLKCDFGNFLILLISVFMVLELSLTENQCSLLMCTNFIYVLWKAWKISNISPFFLFLCTFCFLFIGGHFWGNLLNSDFSIRVGSFMDPTPSSDVEWVKTLIYISRCS